MFSWVLYSKEGIKCCMVLYISIRTLQSLVLYRSGRMKSIDFLFRIIVIMRGRALHSKGRIKFCMVP